MAETDTKAERLPSDDASCGPRVGMRGVFTHLFWLTCLLGILLLFIIGPISVILETVDMVRMRSVTSATILASSVSTDDKGRGQREVRYQFAADGTSFVSSRVFPGWFGNWGRTGGGSSGNVPSVGSSVSVHYSARNPHRSCLWYGWYHWSIGMTLIPYGMLAHGFFRSRPCSGYRFLLRPIGRTMSVLGFVCLAGPAVIEPGRVFGYLAIALGVYVAVVLVMLPWRSSAGSGPRQDGHQEGPSRIHQART